MLLLSLSVVLTACGSAKEEAKKTPEVSNTEVKSNEVLSNAKKEDEKPKEATVSVETTSYAGNDFSFSYPSSWKDAGLDMPAITAAFVDSAPKHGFGDNVNVAVEDSALQAKEAANSTAKQFSNGAAADVIKDYKKIDYKDYSVSENMKTAGVLKAEYIQAQSGTEVVLTQFFVSTGTKIFTTSITFSKKSYEDGGEETVQKIIDSFKVTGTTEASNSTAASNTENVTDQTRTAEMMAYIVPNIIEGGAIDEKTYKYIVDHPDLFPALTSASKKAARAEVDQSITSRHLFKNATPYLDKMVEVSGYVVEITEEQVDQNTTLAQVHILDDNDNSIVGVYVNSTGDILDGDYVTMRGVPTAQYYFDNVSGGTTNAILLTVSTLQKTQ